MSLHEYLKRGIKYVLSGVPQKNVTASIYTMPPNKLLENRISLVTGGTSGIGLEIVKAFLKSGSLVIFTGRNKEKIEKTFDSIVKDNASFSEKLHGVLIDNLDVSSFNDKFQEVLSLIGKGHLDILVNNAGVLGGWFGASSESEYDKVLDTNLKGTFFLSQIVATYMKANGIRGNILNIASSSSLRPASSAYTLSKWGIRGLTLGLAKTLIPYGIVVNGIAPGPTKTPMLVDKKEMNIMNNTPLGRYVMPEEIANMAVILVSDMGRSIVGDIIYMTGGAGLITYDDLNYSF